MNDILFEYFGYTKLKEKQEQIINSILDKKDTIGLLTTGYGKSICYQLPLLIKNKSIIVISPLLSLMEDQQIKLKNNNIPVFCLNSNNLNKEEDKKKLLNNISAIIYISPEYFILCEKFIKELYEKDKLLFITIDESHCISTWNDFRPSYKELKLIKEWINIPILALTATANDIVLNDIKNILKLKDPNIFRTSYFKKNLNINILKKNKFNLDIEEIINQIEEFNNSIIIIYCKTREECDNLYSILKNKNYLCKSYHAGKKSETRNKIQKKFIKKKINIIIATIAFGMGIDIPDIRLIILYGMSKDIESFYQEIGRAGRDGKDSKIYLYWDNNDININKYFLNNSEDEEYKKLQMKKILEMEKFVTCNTCRMKFITNYFNEEISNCNNCDNCLTIKNEIKEDISIECFNIINCIKNLQNNYGISMIVDILYGSISKKINNYIKNLNEYKSLNYLNKNTIKEYIKHLLINNYLIEIKLDNSFGTVIKIKAKGYCWINKNKNIKEIEENEKIYFIRYINDNPNLEVELKNFRKNISIKYNIKLFEVFPNKTIESILKTEINNLNDLYKIDGIGKSRIEKYGEDLLNLIKSTNCKKNLLDIGFSNDDINYINI